MAGLDEVRAMSVGAQCCRIARMVCQVSSGVPWAVVRLVGLLVLAGKLDGLHPLTAVEYFSGTEPCCMIL